MFWQNFTIRSYTLYINSNSYNPRIREQRTSISTIGMKLLRESQRTCIYDGPPMHFRSVSLKKPSALIESSIRITTNSYFSINVRSIESWIIALYFRMFVHDRTAIIRIRYLRGYEYQLHECVRNAVCIVAGKINGEIRRKWDYRGCSGESYTFWNS